MITLRHTHTQQDFCDDSSARTHRPLPDNTQQSQAIDIHAPGGIRTHNSSNRLAADPPLRQCGPWDRPQLVLDVLMMEHTVITRLTSDPANEFFG